MKNIKKVLVLGISIMCICLGYLGENSIVNLLITMVGTSLIACLLYNECDCEKGGKSVKRIVLIVAGYFVLLVLPVYYFEERTSIKLQYVARFFRERSGMIIAIFMTVLICKIISLITIYHKKSMHRMLLIACAVLISIECWQINKIHNMEREISSEQTTNIDPYNKIFREVIDNVEKDHMDVAIQGLRDMYILGEQVDYAIGTDQARKLPLYLREVLTGDQGKMLQDDEKKSVAYTAVDDKERIKYFLDITTQKDGTVITERSSEQLNKALEGEAKDTFFYMQGGKQWVKEEVRDFKDNMNGALQQAMKVLQVEQRYKDYIESTSW